MDVHEPPYPGYRSQRVEPTRDYRVVFWEQQLPDEGADPDQMGWAELTVDLSAVNDVHEAIAWAEANLDAELDSTGSRRGPHGERIYCLYAKIPGEDAYVHIAGWDPVIDPDDRAQALGNLPRRRPA